MNDHANMIGKLRRQTDSLRPPANFFKGSNCRLRELPREVTVFVRLSSEKLLEPAGLHHRFLIILPLKGGGGVIADDRMFMLKPGQALMVFPYQCHGYTRLHRRAIHWLFIGFEMTETAALEPLRNQRFLLTRPILDWISRLVACHLAPTPRQALGEVPVWLELMLSEWLRQVSIQPPRQAPVGEIERGRAAIIGRLAAYVHAHLREGIRLPELARHTAVSGSHLRRLVRQSMGVSLGFFIRKARLIKACALLKTTNRPIGEIAAQCGFSSPYVFSQAFHAGFGMAPRQYRQMTTGSTVASTKPQPALLMKGFVP